jgi:hypothetical protein
MIYVSGLALIMQQLPFCVSHFELAWIYYKLTVDVPRAIEANESSDSGGILDRASLADLEPEESKGATYFTLMTLNILVPVIAAITQVAFYISVKQGGASF